MQLQLTMLMALAFAVPAAAQPRAAPVPVATDAPLADAVTRHRIVTAAGPLAYRARWFETVLRDAGGVPQATISATAYVREGVPAGRRRVMVFFNGGPGASSSPLHTNGFGPRIQGPKQPDGSRALVDNAETLLDVADLLFVDPVGTGFSRPLREGGGAPYWSPQGDADAAIAIIRGWLRDEKRTDAPIVLVGESYGGYRLGMMAPALADLDIAGIVLLSPALDFPADDDQSAIDALPGMAVAAWQQRRDASDQRSVATIWEAARAFAQHDYALALQQGNTLPAAERRRIATRMAALIGLPVDRILATGLRVDTQAFLDALVPGRIVGRLDTRVSAPAPDPAPDPAAATGRPAAANDPSLGLGRSNVIVSRTVGDYLRGELGVRTTRDYASLTLDVNFAWDWRAPTPEPGADWRVADRLAALMRARPAARMLVLGGYYDLATPLLGVRHALSHSAIPRDRVETLALESGHTPFEGPGNLARVAAAIRRIAIAR